MTNSTNIILHTVHGRFKNTSVIEWKSARIQLLVFLIIIIIIPQASC